MSAVAPPTITSLPPAPQRLVDAPEVYIPKADAWADAVHASVPEFNAVAVTTYQNALAAEDGAELAEGHAATAGIAAATALSATTKAATSDSPLEMVDGTQPVSLNETGRTYQDGDVLVATRRGDPNTRLIGEVDNWDGQDFDFIIGEDGVIDPLGTADTYDDWDFLPSSFYDMGATKAQMLAMTRSDVAATPLAMKEMLEPFALTDGATVTPSGLNGLDFTWPIGGNRTLAPITNTYKGASGTIEITQDGVGSRILAVGGTNVWRRRGGLGTLSTGAGKIDELEYKVRAVDGSGTATRITYDIIKDPT